MPAAGWPSCCWSSGAACSCTRSRRTGRLLQRTTTPAIQLPPSTTQRDPGQTGQYRYFENPDAARPLPVTLPPSQFQNEGIANSYAVAKEIPEVLAQQPCLCGCDNTSDDHRSLLDCYIDDHASGCMVCMKEAVYASEMTEAGESAEWIRDAILRNEFADTNIGN